MDSATRNAIHMIDAEHRAIISMIEERNPPQTGEDVQELAYLFDFLAAYYRARGQTEAEALASEQAQQFRERAHLQTCKQ